MSSKVSAVWNIRTPGLLGRRVMLLIRMKVVAAVCVAVVACSGVGSAPEVRAAEVPVNQWTVVDDELTGSREGQLLVYAPWLRKAVLFDGRIEGETSYMQVFDPRSRGWSDFSSAKPELRFGASAADFCAVCEPESKQILYLYRDRLFSFDSRDKKWREHAAEPLLSSLTGRSMAYDPLNRQLVVVGSGTAGEELGWMVTLTYDPSSGKWQKRVVGDQEAHLKQAALLKGIDRLAELVGRTRMTWYRDPAGVGTEEERRELAQRCRALAEMPGLEAVRGEIDLIGDLIGQKKTLEALKAARELKLELEETAEAGALTPPARRNSPLVCDPANRVMVLFGGDHEDYLTNDTWVLDLTDYSWRRAKPKLAPSPRAGHALVYLPGCQKIALWDGYRQTSNPSYRNPQAGLLPHRELWLYDTKADRWELLASWPTRKGDKTLPEFAGFISDYGLYASPALAVDEQDTLILSTRGAKVHSKHEYGNYYYSATWVLPLDASRVDAAATVKLGVAPNQREHRTGIFTAAFCEVAERGTGAALDRLEPNTWTRLPAVVPNPCRGDRQREWCTATWDPDNGQILYWGGGHCVTAGSPVLHYSPASHRMAEGYDAEESYSHQGSPGHTLLGRPWVPGHSYHVYAYDPKWKVMVAAKMDGTYLYDPLRMDWLKGKVTQPFYGHCHVAILGSSTHGVVSWAPTLTGALHSATVSTRIRRSIDIVRLRSVHLILH